MIASLFCSIGSAVSLRTAALCLGLAAAGLSMPSFAADLAITAEFRPSAIDPTNNKFKNTTPQSGYCARYSVYCKPGDFTIATGINIDSRRLGNASGEIREYWYQAVDGNRKDVIVRDINGNELHVQLRLFLIGFEWGLGNDGSNPGRLGASSGGCLGRIGVTTSQTYTYAWEVPEGSTVCWRMPNRADSTGGLTFSIGYYLETPNPLSAVNGVYTGSVSYSVGNQQQIDLGEGNYSDSVLNLNLTLTVAHEFYISFPSAAPRVTLAPIGGWQQWTDHGNPPSRLQQELPFTLTASSDFSIKMRCEHDSDRRCGIKDLAAGTVVPVDVDVTLPGMSEVNSGARAVEFPLAPHHAATAPRFRPDSYMINRASKLRFSANGNAVTEMLKSPGSRWQGDVTIVFDSNP